MSSLIVNKYTICLYVQGLGQKISFFDDTIDLITSACPQKHASFSLSVNMQDFDSISGHFSDPNDEDVFDQTTELLVNTALANPNKTIHAKIYINIDPYGQRYDIIENQKTKLVYLIDRIKSLSNSVRIVLIGHSQGGLVNLEAAIARPYQIERLISLSTPYAPVYVAKLFEQINEIRVIFNGVFEILNGGPYGLSPYSSICVSTLASETYFNDLKGRWNALPYRPHLLAICGVSAKMETVGPLMPFQIGPDVSWQASTDYRAFDGLVSAQEQNAISHAQIVNLYDSSLPCASTLRFLNVPCANSHSAGCIGSCLLPGISPTSVVSTYLLHSSTYESDVFNAVGQATSNQSFTGPDYVRPVYDVFLGCFSHSKICTSPEAIQLIRGKLES